MVIGRAVSAANGPCRKCQVNNNGIPRRKPGKSNVSLVEKPCKIADTFLWTSWLPAMKTTKCSFIIWCESSKFEYLSIFNVFFSCISKKGFYERDSAGWGGSSNSSFNSFWRPHSSTQSTWSCTNSCRICGSNRYFEAWNVFLFNIGRVWSTIALIHDRMIKMHGNLDCSPVHHHHVLPER